MVLHGAVSAELFVDSNGEGFFLLAKFAPILDAIREKNPYFMRQDFGSDQPLFRRGAALRDYPQAREASRSARQLKIGGVTLPRTAKNTCGKSGGGSIIRAR